MALLWRLEYGIRYDGVLLCFCGDVGVFGTFAVIGGVVKRDLTSWTTYLLGAVIALIIVSLLNVFVFQNGFVNLASVLSV